MRELSGSYQQTSLGSHTGSPRYLSDSCVRVRALSDASVSSAHKAHTSSQGGDSAA